MSQPHVSIVIPCLNESATVGACVHVARDAVARLDEHGEVIVVDNGSTDGSPELVRGRFPTVELIANGENRGFSAANNQGIEQALGRYVFLLNSDAALGESALGTLVAYADQHPEAGVLGPKLLNPDGSLQPSGGRFPTLTSTVAELFGLGRLTGRPRYGTRRDYDRPAAVDEVSGAAMLIARRVIDQLGGLDERFAWGYEDVDFCLRARRAGWQVHYVPQARVVHDWGGSRRLAPAATTLKAIAGRRWYFRKHFGAGQAGLVMLATAVSHGLRLIVFAIAGLGNPRLRERAPAEWAIIRGLLGDRP